MRLYDLMRENNRAKRKTNPQLREKEALEMVNREERVC